jgi:hypothetical protein
MDPLSGGPTQFKELKELKDSALLQVPLSGGNTQFKEFKELKDSAL